MDNQDYSIPSAELPPVADLQRVSLQPGDVLVVRLNAPMVSREQLVQIQQRLESIFPNNKVLVVPKDTDMFVMAGAGAAPAQ